jgi:trans-aconitate methyltransferase
VIIHIGNKIDMSITNSSKIDLYKQLHQIDESYGSTSLKFIDEVSVMIEYLNPKSILDYGCGKGTLIDEIQKRYPEIQCHKYDPSIPEYDTIPVSQADMVLNTDVLEHIPVDDIDEVLKNISSITQNVYFNLHHGRASTILPNGENAHCTVRSPNWYGKKLKQYFGHVELLPGRRHVASVGVTFKIDQASRNTYLKIVRERKVPVTFENHLRFFVKNLIRDYLGIQIHK